MDDSFHRGIAGGAHNRQHSRPWVASLVTAEEGEDTKTHFVNDAPNIADRAKETACQDVIAIKAGLTT